MAWACSCAPHDPTESFEAGETIYVARVISAGGMPGCASAEFEVTEAFQGVEVGQTITRDVYVGGGGGDCSLAENPFQPDESWLLYGKESEQISLCSGHRPAGEAAADIETLRGLVAE